TPTLVRSVSSGHFCWPTKSAPTTAPDASLIGSLPRDVGFAEDGRVSVVRFSRVPFCIRRTLRVERGPDRACTILLLDRRCHAHVLVPVLCEERGHAAVLLHNRVNNGVVRFVAAEIKIAALEFRGSKRFRHSFQVRHGRFDFVLSIA